MSYLDINSSIAEMINITFNNSTSENSTSDLGPRRDSLYLVIPITIIYSIIFVTGLFGNIITCTVIIRNKSMHTATNYYLFSLAISDLLLLVSGMPQEMYFIWSKWPYIFGPVFCILRGLAAETSTNASVLTITLFTVERYLAICHPFASQKMSKLSRAVKHILILWVVSFVLALPQALEFGITIQSGETMCQQTEDRKYIEHSFEISLIFFFFAPMVLITVLYYLIAKTLNRSHVDDDFSTRMSFNSSMNTKKVHRKNSTQSTKRVIKMLIAVVVAFFLCWAPFHAQRLVANYGKTEENEAKKKFLLSLYDFMTYFSGIFYYMSTCINPIFYHVMSNKFRDAFKTTIKQFCCINTEQPLPQHCSYTTVPMSRHGTRFEGSRRDRFRSSR